MVFVPLFKKKKKVGGGQITKRKHKAMEMFTI